MIQSVTVDRGRVKVTSVARDSAGLDREVLVTGPGIAVNAGESGLVRVFSDAEVGPGERIDGDVVAVFGSVLVEGSVSGDVVAVFGSVHLAPGAAVDGDVVAVGGGLEQAKGATIGGESVSVGFLPIPWGPPGLPVLLFSVFSAWLVSLFGGWLVAVLIPERMLRVAATASQRGPASFFLGLVSLPLMLFASMLLAITVIGIPVALMLPLLYALLVWTGQIATLYVLGSGLLRRRLGQGGPMMPILVGTLFVALFFAMAAIFSVPQGFPRTVALFFALLGVLLVFCLSTIGVGAVLLSRFGARPREASFEPAAGAGPPPAAPPESAPATAG